MKPNSIIQVIEECKCVSNMKKVRNRETYDEWEIINDLTVIMSGLWGQEMRNIWDVRTYRYRVILWDEGSLKLKI
jgi:uncharacterized alpha-E superfamily protein